jgi:6-phosphogluconolactonase
VSGPEVIVVADPSAASDAAAAHIAESLMRAVEGRGRADWMTTGGSSPIDIYNLLVVPPLVDRVPWRDVHVWWGDDRYVPRDHPLSNVKPFDDIMLDIGNREEGTVGVLSSGVRIPLDQIHPFRTTDAIGRARGAAWCAEALAAELAAADIPREGGWPAVDLMLLGIGKDGHLLSVFPGSSAIGAPELAVAIPAPTHIEPHVERVTVNPALVATARDVLVVATGSEKATAIGQAFGPPGDPRELPARLAVRTGATWILDEAAAAEMPGR